MKANRSAAFQRVWAELESRGVLLAADAALPSVVSLVAEAPVGGSWWAHPQSHAIYKAAKDLARHPEVLTARLLSGKVTFVHKRLWPALMAVATSPAPWQLQGLSPRASSLLSHVTKAGRVRTDRLAAASGLRAKAWGEAARELEARLLVYGESIHTERGAHAKYLESWEHLAKRLRIRSRRMTPELAKQQFEEIVAPLQARFQVSAKLPWENRRQKSGPGKGAKRRLTKDVSGV